MTLLREDNEGEGNSHKTSRAELEVNPKLFVSQNVAEFQISPTRLIRFLLAVIAGLVILSTIGQVVRHIYHRGNLLGLIDLFYVDAETSIPTAYSSFSWLLCSFTAAIIAITKKQAGDRFVKHWKQFALMFAYLALDEVAAIHELSMEPLQHLFHTSGFFYFAWVIPGTIFFLLFALSCFKFVKALPMKTRILLMSAGAVFMTGAIGVEMVGGQYSEVFGAQADLTYALIATVEETLEMLGILTLLYALLSYMGTYTKPFKVRVLSRQHCSN